RHDVITRGYFTQMYQDEKELTRTATTGTGIDALILARLQYAFRQDTAIDKELVSCDLTITTKAFNHNGDTTGNDSFQVTGPGYTQAAALQRGIELLAEQFTTRILNPLTR